MVRHKGIGQQCSNRSANLGAQERAAYHHHVWITLGKYLSTRTAWHGGCGSIGNDNAGYNIAMAGGRGRRYCRAFGALRKAVRSVFDVAANVDAAIGVDKGAANVEVRIWCPCFATHGYGRFDGVMFGVWCHAFFLLRAL